MSTYSIIICQVFLTPIVLCILPVYTAPIIPRFHCALEQLPLSSWSSNSLNVFPYFRLFAVKETINFVSKKAPPRHRTWYPWPKRQPNNPAFYGRGETTAVCLSFRPWVAGLLTKQEGKPRVGTQIGFFFGTHARMHHSKVS